MSLAIVGHHASYEFRWRRWALLSDTVVAVLEGGICGARFPFVHAIGAALVESPLRLPARDLTSELRVIRTELRGRPLDALALSPRTAAVLYPGAVLDASRALTNVELRQVAPAGPSVDLADYFASMIDSLLDVCAHPDAHGSIEVLDG